MSRDIALQVMAKAQGVVSRAHIEHAIKTFQASYAAKDVATRIALFADDALFEDPIGSPPIRGRQALAGFFAETVASGIEIELTSERIVVSGDEALSITNARWGFPGTDPARVGIFQIFAFDAQGRIASLRIFMDESCLK